MDQIAQQLEALLPTIANTSAYLAMYIAVIWIAKSILPLVAKYNIYSEVSERDNMAVGVSYSGFLVAVTIIYASVLFGPSQGLAEDAIAIATYSALGCVLLFISRFVNDKLILHTFKINKEMVEDKNIGTGVVVLGSYIASSLVIGGAVHGQGGGLETAIVFFVIGQLSLVLCSKLYNLITPFDVHEQIEKGNTAIGISYAGTLIALGIIMANAASGNFSSWEYNISTFIFLTVIGLFFIPLIRTFMDKILIPHYDLNKELEKDSNSAAGLIEAVTVISTSLILSVAI